MAIAKKDLIAVFIPPQKHDFCFEKLFLNQVIASINSFLFKF